MCDSDIEKRTIMSSNDNDEIRSRKSSERMPSKVSATDDDGYGPDPEDAVGRKSILLGVAGFILITEFCERLAYYGFAGSLVLFFQTQLNLSNADADVQYSAWSGFCYVTPLLGGYIADTYLGRYWTIMIFCSIYLAGLVMVVFGSIPGHVSADVFFPAIYIIAIGTGGIKPNVSTMGADQFDDRYSADRKEKGSYFNWFYWSINLGALISHTLVAYVCQYGIPALGGEEWGFLVGYTIPAIMMTFAILVFILGTPRYRHQKPQGSVLATAIKICFEAVWTKRNVRGTLHVLDRAKTANGGSFTHNAVEGVKLVTRLTPFLIVMVPYWGIYSQMSTVFQNQGCQMNLSMGSADVPVSALNAFDTIAILLLVPVFDKFVYPYLKRIGYPLSTLQKMGWGFFFALSSMLVAAIIEIYRVDNAPPAGDWYDKAARDNITPCQSIDDYSPVVYQEWYAGINDASKPMNCWQICSTLVDGLLDPQCIQCDNIPQVTNISVFWQVFQFCLVGTSEILASVAALEFFYGQAPTALRSVTQSLNLLTNALGSFIVIPILLLVNSNKNDEWVPSNLDEGHLSYYFFLLAALMGLNIVLFYFLARNYEYKTQEELRVLENLTAEENEEVRGLTSPVRGEDEDGYARDSTGSSSQQHNRMSHISSTTQDRERAQEEDEELEIAFNPQHSSSGNQASDYMKVVPEDDN